METPQTKKIKIFNGFWTIQDVRNNKDSLFVFGDNDVKKGKGGQAIIRKEPNAIGIPTKKYPSYNKSAYYVDDELESNKQKIDNGLQLVLLEFLSKDYKYLVLPKDGFGTGLANLPKGAPLTFKHIKVRINALKKLFS